MDHDHSGHQMLNMPPEPMCNMNMLFTWDTTDLCIIFHGWHIHNTVQLIFSLLGVVILTAGYEAVRELARRYEAAGSGALQLESSEEQTPNSPLLRLGNTGRPQSKMVKGLFYAVQVFYSFFIMLLFMTYNGWVMLAVAVGAFVGYMAFGSRESSASKTVACH